MVITMIDYKMVTMLENFLIKHTTKRRQGAQGQGARAFQVWKWHHFERTPFARSGLQSHL